MVDGTGGVVTNAVVIIEDDRGQRVTTGNVAMPNGAEVIDLSVEGPAKSRTLRMFEVLEAYLELTFHFLLSSLNLKWYRYGAMRKLAFEIRGNCRLTPRRVHLERKSHKEAGL